MVDGWRRPNASHNHAMIGAKIQMKAELSAWKYVLGKLQPNTDVRVSRSANRFSVEPACSNSDQNSAAARNNTPMTYRRLRSSGVQSLAKNSQPKNTTVRMISM